MLLKEIKGGENDNNTVEFDTRGTAIIVIVIARLFWRVFSDG